MQTKAHLIIALEDLRNIKKLWTGQGNLKAYENIPRQKCMLSQ